MEASPFRDQREAACGTEPLYDYRDGAVSSIDRALQSLTSPAILGGYKERQEGGPRK